MLSLRHVTKTYGAVKALNDISLDITQGSVVAILGGSGAGKSTLLRLINGFVSCDANQTAMSYNGQSIARLKGKALRTWRSQCGMVFQHFNLSPRLDVLTNVLTGALCRASFPAALFGLFSDEDHAEAIELLNNLGLRDLAFARTDTLSGGQQQRVAIARTLMQRPKIILADEPIAALDPHNATLVMELLQQAARSRNVTVICNLHQPDTAMQYCDRIIGLKQGAVYFDGTPEQFTPEIRHNLYQVGVSAVNDTHTQSAQVARVSEFFPTLRATAV